MADRRNGCRHRRHVSFVRSFRRKIMVTTHHLMTGTGNGLCQFPPPLPSEVWNFSRGRCTLAIPFLFQWWAEQVTLNSLPATWQCISNPPESIDLNVGMWCSPSRRYPPHVSCTYVYISWDHPGRKWQPGIRVILAGIPQVFFKRVLACKTTFQAELMTTLSAVGCLVLAWPAMIIGAAAKTTSTAGFG